MERDAKPTLSAKAASRASAFDDLLHDEPSLLEQGRFALHDAVSGLLRVPTHTTEHPVRYLIHALKACMPAMVAKRPLNAVALTAVCILLGSAVLAQLATPASARNALIKGKPQTESLLARFSKATRNLVMGEREAPMLLSVAAPAEEELPIPDYNRHDPFEPLVDNKPKVEEVIIDPLEGVSYMGYIAGDTKTPDVVILELAGAGPNGSPKTIIKPVGSTISYNGSSIKPLKGFDTYLKVNVNGSARTLSVIPVSDEPVATNGTPTAAAGAPGLGSGNLPAGLAKLPTSGGELSELAE